MGDSEKISERIRSLIATDKLERALEEMRQSLPEVAPEVEAELLQHQARLRRSRNDERRAMISRSEMEQIRTHIGYAILDLLNQPPFDRSSAPAPENNRRFHSKERAPQVFISYSHEDSSVAQELCSALQDRGITVQIDNNSLGAGENIEQFILRSIRDTNATILLVSRRALLSPWVGLETVNRFDQERWVENKHFIACYLDDDFWAAGFRLEATTEIDRRLKEIEQLLPRYIEQKLDTEDLNRDRSRLYELRNNLGKILDRLKNSLCLDIRAAHFENSVARVTEILRVGVR